MATVRGPARGEIAWIQLRLCWWSTDSNGEIVSGIDGHSCPATLRLYAPTLSALRPSPDLVSVSCCRNIPTSSQPQTQQHKIHNIQTRTTTESPILDTNLGKKHSTHSTFPALPIGKRKVTACCAWRTSASSEPHRTTRTLAPSYHNDNYTSSSLSAFTRDLSPQ